MTQKRKSEAKRAQELRDEEAMGRKKERFEEPGDAPFIFSGGNHNAKGKVGEQGSPVGVLRVGSETPKARKKARVTWAPTPPPSM